MQAFGRYLLGLSRDLNRVLDLEGLVRCAHGAVLARTGYRSCWLYVVEPGGTEARLLAIFGTAAGLVTDEVSRLPLDGDPMIEEIFRGTEPVVVQDARADPRTDKRIVGLLGNRTIVNIPLVLDAEHVGALGVGTFGEEGVRPPTFDELDELGAIAAQVAGVAGRLREQQARRAAEELLHRTQRMESLGRLASGVAHDFNNVLHVILGQTELLAGEVATAPARQRVDTIRQAGERAARLTGQLLALGRRNAHGSGPLDVALSLGELAELLRQTLPADIELALELVEPLPAVSFDLVQLEQLVLNLVGNARDALEQGGAITVRAALGCFDGRSALHLEVSDTGFGMTSEVLSRVMEPYFTTKHAERGTGLGLPVVRAIVDQHGGELTLDSVEGLGTTVRVVLPVKLDERADELDPRGHGEQILVVDDDASVREMLREVLRFGGYEVAAVADGSAALDLIRTRPVDLVVSDLVVPGLDGPAMLAAAREHGEALPFVFLEGQDANGAATAVDGHPRVQVLPKPFALKQLLASMRAALG